MIEPYDPYCETFAKDMEFLDHNIYVDEEDLKVVFAEVTSIETDLKLQKNRADYVRREEGTYNAINGHFACDNCYIKIGMPTVKGGWVAP